MSALNCRYKVTATNPITFATTHAEFYDNLSITFAQLIMSQGESYR